MRGGNIRRRFLCFAMALLFLCGTPVVHASRWEGMFQAPQPQTEASPPRLKLYAKTEKVMPTTGAKAISTVKGQEETAAYLYDSREDTVCGGEEALWVTLDLGTARRLCAVRYLPSQKAEHFTDRLAGTRFYVSTDQKNYVPVAEIAPSEETPPANWQEIAFGGSGEYRYVKIELPGGAYLSEVEWMAYTEWNFTPAKEKGKQNMSLKLYAYEAREEMDTTVLTTVYNKDGVLKNFASMQQEFVPQTQQSILVEIPDLVREQGDSYRVLVFDSDGGQPLAQPLEYRDNAAGRAFGVSNVFSDNMLIQAEKPFTIWGTAAAGAQIRVMLENSLGGKVEQIVTADAHATWEVDLGTFSPGGDYTLTVTCGKAKRVYQNLTFGDVWLCVGQSNMDYYMLAGKDTADWLDSKEGRREAVNPQIRLLNLWNKGVGGAGAATEALPLRAGVSAWSDMNRDAANYCPVIGYYFAQAIRKEYPIPIGIIGAAVGDTEINRWIPQEEACGSFTPTDGGLYYNRLAPLSKLQIRGILMYQGEADEYRTHLTTAQYRDAMVALVECYRRIWGEDLPFYWAQLTRYKKDESAVREGQRLAMDRIQNPQNLGVISLMDLYGEYEAGQGNCREDIHPHQKKEVAERFFRLAKRDVYGETELAAVGPSYRSMRVIGDKIELTFACTGALTVLPVSRYADRQGEERIKKENADPNQPHEFEIAGADGVFYPATAQLRENRVILSCPQVKKPTAARYAWGAYPEMPNLTDETGLPSLSFSTETVR